MNGYGNGVCTDCVALNGLKMKVWNISPGCYWTGNGVIGGSYTVCGFGSFWILEYVAPFWLLRGVTQWRLLNTLFNPLGSNIMATPDPTTVCTVPPTVTITPSKFP
jgi:hypothetical protein